MMKNIKSKILLIAMAVPLLFAACKLNVNPAPETEKEQEPRYVTVYPSLNLEARTIMPDFSDITVETLSYKVTVGYMDGEWSDTVISSQNYDTLMQGFKVPEGNLWIDLSGTYNSLTFRDRLENVEVVYGQEKELVFVLYPEKSSSSHTVKFTLDFDFPADSNPVFSSGALKYSDTTTSKSLSNSDVTLTTIEATEDNGVEIPAHPHVNVSFSNSCYNYNYNDYFVEITFNNVDEENNVIGMYKYDSAVIFGYNATSVSEHVDVKKFANVYTITYHLSNGTTQTATYSPAYGFELYSTNIYTWFTDPDCTVKATGEAGSCSGNIDLYSSVETNTHDLYICDTEGNPVKIKTTGGEPTELDCVSVKNGDYAYIYRGQSEKLSTANIVNYNISREGYYIKAVYKDLEKKSSFCSTTSTSGSTRLSADTILYVEYAPIVTVKVVNYTNPEQVLAEMQIYSGSYRLEDTYIRDYSFSDFYDTYEYYSENKSLKVYKYYSSLDNVDSVISKGKGISVSADETVIYADVEVPHTLKIVNIDAEDITSEDAVIATLSIVMREYKLTYNTLSTFNSSSVSLPENVRILHYYSDVDGTQEVELNTSFTEVNEDVTLYAKVDAPHTLTVVDIDNPSTVLKTIEIRMKQYELNYYRLYSFNHGATFDTFNIEKYYSDAEGENELVMDTIFNDIEEDVTLYAKVDVPHKLTVYEMNDLTTVALEMDIEMQTLKVNGNTVYTTLGNSWSSISGDTIFAFYYVDENDEYQPLENNYAYTDITKDVTLYARRNRTVVLRDTNDATDPWTSTTGIYEYEVEEAGAYEIYVKDNRPSGNDNYFFFFVDEECKTSSDADSGETKSYTLSVGQKIRVKHVPYHDHDNYKNLNEISNYTNDSGDQIRISKAERVLDPLPTSSSGSSE